MLWYTARMPDDHPAIFPCRDPEQSDLGALKTDIQCFMWQIAKLRRDLVQAVAWAVVWAGLGFGVAPIVSIGTWSRYVSA
jgi:hypothetical protein